MKELIDFTKKYDLAEIRSAFYYVSRYLKQADHFEKYKKDLFEDDFNSSPTESEKKLTLGLIKIIEDKAGKKAALFTSEDYINWMDTINNVESSLDPEPSTTTIKLAEAALEKVFIPNLGKND